MNRRLATRGTRRTRLRLRLPLAAAAGLLAALLAGSLGGCLDEPPQGGTDEVENPALTAVLEDAGGAAVAGSVRLYARYQNPLKDSQAVLVRPAAGNGARITAEELLAAMDASAGAGLPWPDRDSAAFNLVGIADGREAFAAEYLLVAEGPAGWLFKRVRPPQGGEPLARGSLSIRLPVLPAVLDYAGNVGPRGRELGLKSLFVQGSPYRADIRADGAFTLARLARGSYDVKALDAEGKAFSPFEPLSTDSAFAPGDWSEADLIWVGD